MEIWDKIRRFLLIWVGILVILLVAAVIVYWSDLKAAVVGSVTGTLGSLLTVGVILVGLWLLFRALFPRR